MTAPDGSLGSARWADVVAAFERVAASGLRVDGLLLVGAVAGWLPFAAATDDGDAA